MIFSALNDDTCGETERINQPFLTISHTIISQQRWEITQLFTESHFSAVLMFLIWDFLSFPFQNIRRKNNFLHLHVLITVGTIDVPPENAFKLLDIGSPAACLIIVLCNFYSYRICR